MWRGRLWAWGLTSLIVVLSESKLGAQDSICTPRVVDPVQDVEENIYFPIRFVATSLDKSDYGIFQLPFGGADLHLEETFRLFSPTIADADNAPLTKWMNLGVQMYPGVLLYFDQVEMKLNQYCEYELDYAFRSDLTFLGTLYSSIPFFAYLESDEGELWVVNLKPVVTSIIVGNAFEPDDTVPETANSTVQGGEELRAPDLNSGSSSSSLAAPLSAGGGCGVLHATDSASMGVWVSCLSALALLGWRRRQKLLLSKIKASSLQ